MAYDKIKRITQKISEAHAEAKRDGRQALGEAFKEWFATEPTIKKVVWTQTTPFNDGDSTHFTVSNFFPHISYEHLKALVPSFDPEDEGEDGDAYSELCYGGEMAWFISKRKEPECQRLTESFKQFCAVAYNETLLELLFDVGVQITATPDGEFEVEGYCGDY